MFAKEITNPIETVVFYTDVNPQFTYLNAASAELQGLEVSWHRELDAFSTRLRNWSFAGNYSYTDSTINVFDSLEGRVSPALSSVLGDLTTSERPMQGQSPNVLNMLLSYETRKVTSTLVFNRIGERIVSLGTDGSPDMYEQPFDQLDLVSSYTMRDGIKLGLSIRNLLDGGVEWDQGGTVVRSYKRWRSYSFSMKYDF